MNFWNLGGGVLQNPLATGLSITVSTYYMYCQVTQVGRCMNESFCQVSEKTNPEWLSELELNALDIYSAFTTPTRNRPTSASFFYIQCVIVYICIFYTAKRRLNFRIDCIMYVIKWSSYAVSCVAWVVAWDRPVWLAPKLFLTFGAGNT